MRRIRDATDREWDVVVGRASWGTLLALFVPVEGEGARQAHLDAASQADAERDLARLTERELLGLLEASRPRNP